MRSFLIAELHPITLLGTRDLLNEKFPGCQIAIARTREELVREIRQHGCSFDVAILNVRMKDQTLISCIDTIKAQCPALGIAVLGREHERVYAKWFLRHGVNAYMSQLASETEFLNMLDAVISGRIYLGDRVLQAWKCQSDERLCSGFGALSVMELEVIHHLVNGDVQADVAIRLGKSASTVATYFARAAMKLGTRDMIAVSHWIGRA
ncbi:MAG: hypothetical protein P0Y53_01290 [Candidatus Pseudobacter hemicellulosilyticus]|uniref:Response regulatory domain-containing protein n=1 Tax=Candidatus Pseudobacter hemicellulosilyticus TaxID=3121375 RepID=A0AAJ5WSB5_9BACT|nr:MAG: hypothetical protein P0Y53_01290 [Pseudobacter sp.]